MIGDEAMSQLEPLARKSVEDALMALTRSGVLQIEIDSRGMWLVSGSSETPAEVLAREIQEYRVRTALIRGLHEQGQQLINKE